MKDRYHASLNLLRWRVTELLERQHPLRRPVDDAIEMLTIDHNARASTAPVRRGPAMTTETLVNEQVVDGKGLRGHLKE